MKVRRLVLENFRRHRATEWEPADGVTAVVGANGSGKSTLLEAIAFALYGTDAIRTRKDLVRHTEAGPGDAVHVELQLDLAGQAWTVVRELRGKQQTPSATLTIDGVVHVPGGAGSADAVTLAVTRSLGLDRDGFFQTVVAQQGELDRLGRMKAAERRSFILGMVGIGAVDDAIQHARRERAAARVRLDEARRALPDQSALEAALVHAQQRREHALAQASAASARTAAAQADIEAARKAWQSHQQAETSRKVAAQALATAEEAHRHAVAAQQQAQRRVQESQTARERLALAQPRALEHTVLEQAWQGATVLVARHQARTAAEARVQALAAEIERRVATVQLDVPPPPDVAAAEAALEAARSSKATATAELAHLDRALREAGERITRLAGLEAECPTCGSALTPATLGQHRSEAQQVRQALEQQRAETARTLALAKAAEAAQAAAVASARQALAAREAELARRAAEARRLEDLRAQHAAEAANLGEALGPVPDVAALRARLDDARRARDEVLRHQDLAARLEAAQADVSRAFEAVQAAAGRVAAARATLASLPDPAPELAAAQAALASADAAHAEAQRTLLQARLEQQHAERDEADARAALARLAEARVRAEALARELASWTALAGAANDGLLDRFKDHLVARTAPLVAQEASRLLGALTGGRYTELVLDEDYEVWVLDGGARYAIGRFSGGEQDLIHLALRLAISRILATRAGGAEVRFLALDEVFGSLDAQHRGLVVDALHQLGGLYSQVLAITHDEDLQEMLDQAVRVTLVDGETRLEPNG